MVDYIPRYPEYETIMISEYYSLSTSNNEYKDTANIVYERLLQQIMKHYATSNKTICLTRTTRPKVHGSSRTE
jgi:hypothetical protein